MRKLQCDRSLALVVSCTQGKTLDAADDLLLRNLVGERDRCRLWVSRVQQAGRTTELRDLYKGQQWRSSLALERFAGGRYRTVKLWVVSAGLGLRPAEHHAPGYGASFTTGQDAVGPTRAERRAWWSALHTQFELPGLEAARSSADEMLVVLSPSYLSVIKPDLNQLTDEGVAVLTSNQVEHPRGMSSAGLQLELGGSDQTLNQRAAMRLIDLTTTSPIGADPVREAWLAWAGPRRTTRAYDRTALGDDALREIIRAGATGEAASATRLLKQLRRDGYACEQKRFHRLYAETTAGAA